MGYKIVLDSCGELPEEKKQDPHFERVALELMIGDYRVWDDDAHFDQLDFIKRVAKSPLCPKSACPSPERYMRSMDVEEGVDVYVITLSGALSGSYNSAELARKMFLEEHPGRNIQVIDSCSASCGETQIAFLIERLAKEGLPFEEIVKQALAYRDDMTTYFVLDDLDPLRKNGRLTGLKSLMASTLSIKPVLSSTIKGEIQQLGQAIGSKKALTKMIEIIAKEKPDSASRSLMITHCNAPERAEFVRSLCEKILGYSTVLIMNMAGVSTLYASDGGIIVTL